MDHHEILLITGICVLGLVVLNILSYFTQKFKLFPDIIWILLLGVGYGSIAHFTDIGIPELSVSPELVLFVFVPLLIFASAQKICLFHFRKVLLPSSIIGSIGILISLFIIGGALHFVFNIELLSALLFGAIISATDPLAVGPLLHGNTKVNEYQKLLIEGESILNDGFVVTVAGILSLVIFEGEAFSLIKSGEDFFVHVVGALVIGIVLGRSARWLLKLLHEEHFILRTNITLALAFGTYAVSEALGYSGILSVLASALAYGYRPDMDDEQTKTQSHLWEYFEYLANAVLFFLLGASIFTQADFSLLTAGLIVSALVLLFISRFGALLSLFPFLRFDGRKLKSKTFWLLNFSGARGAVSIALLLLLPNSFEYKSLFLSLAFIMIFFSLVIYPLIMKKLLASEPEKE